MPNYVTWRKTKGFLNLCQTFSLSWSTVTRWMPDLRRWGQEEMSSMPSMEAAWRTFTQSFTTGCTVTSTRSVQPLQFHLFVTVTADHCGKLFMQGFFYFKDQVKMFWLTWKFTSVRCGFFFLCRTQCLEREPTSPVISAWLSSTAPTAEPGEKVCWVHCSAVLLCVKS